MCKYVAVGDTKERINWIDWGKALAVCTVVFCHLPQSQEWFYYRYLQSVIIVIFFFLSGYLKKDRGSERENWRKYWHSLILPYFLYNAIIYPYWILKYYMTHGVTPDLFHAMRPIIGTFLLQHDSTYAEPLNGPLWYLPAILIMHITIDLCRRTRHQHFIMVTLCIVSVILYAANKYWYFAPNLTPMALMRDLPYYYIGYVLGQHKKFRNTKGKTGITGCVCCLIGSLLLFAWHLHAYFAGQHLLQIILFYPVNIGFLFGALYGCKLLDRYKWSVITNLSMGTLVIIGLHTVIISGVNLVNEHIRGLHNVICYEWYEAILVSIIVIALLYPIIIFGKYHFPILLGKQGLRTTSSTKA